MEEPRNVEVTCYQCGSPWMTSPGENLKCFVCGVYLAAPSEQEVADLFFAEVRKKNIRLVYSKKTLKSL